MSASEELNLGRRRRLPVVLSAEEAECGLACMVMVGYFFGHNIDLNGLRQRFSLSLSGLTLRGLIGLADQLGFSTRALKVETQALHNVRTPAILHWDLNHFVVLKKANRRSVVIHDPSRGAQTISINELGKHFTGVALELAPARHFRTMVARPRIRLTSLWSRSSGFWSAAWQVMGLSAALQILAFVAPLQIQLVIDQAILRSDTSLLNVLGLGFGAMVLAQAATEALRGWALQVFGSLLSYQIVGNIVAHLLRLSADFFEKRNIGDVLSRLNSASAIQETLSKGVVSSIVDGVMALLSISILVVYSSVLAGVALASLALNLAVVIIAFPIVRARTEELMAASAKERSYLMESVRAASVVKLMGREAERESSWRSIYASTINASVSLGRFQLTSTMAQATITGLSTVLITYLGARAVISGHGFSVGMLLAFLAYRQTFNDRTISLLNQGAQFRLLSLHLERLSDIVTAPSDCGTKALPPIDVKGAVSLVNVSYRYGAPDPWVLKNVSLEIRPGDFVAITGPSGGGKTTLLKIMLGLQSPTEGQVLLDGMPATPELWRVWRERVGVVSQNDQLLSGSLAENIAFFDPVLDMVRVQAAARAAQVHSDIQRMPMQYLSLVGDMGSALSGGQRQRILFARLLYRSPAVLFLDEGTANLDPESERLIAKLVSGSLTTRIVVAHRPEIIREARRRVYVSGENGAVVEVPVSELEPN